MWHIFLSSLFKTITMARETQRDELNTGRTDTNWKEGENRPAGFGAAERENRREEETEDSRYADTDAAAIRPVGNQRTEEGDEDYDDEDDDTDDLVGDDEDDLDEDDIEDDIDVVDDADIDDEDIDDDIVLDDDEDEDKDDVR